MARIYKPATFQPTVRPDWGGALSYLPESEKAEILEAIIKYPSLECNSVFWTETIKPDLDLQHKVFKDACERKKQAIRDRWGKISTTYLQHMNKISTTDVKDMNEICNTYVIDTEDKDKDKEKDKDDKKRGVGEKETFEKQADENFERFWSSYTPVKTTDGRVVSKGSRKEAQTKYLKLVKSGVNPNDILSGLNSYIQHCQRNNQLTCGATVFLNQERWKDDYSPTTALAQQRMPQMSLKEMQELQKEIEIQKILNGER